jgi:antitoxin component of MazEF toxin-antitoxin module
MSTFEVRKIMKVGNSFAVCISKQMLTFLELSQKDLVAVRVSKEQIQITKFESPFKQNKQKEN